MPILSFDNFKSKADVSLEFTQEEFDYIKSNTKRTVVDVYSAEEVSNWSPSSTALKQMEKLVEDELKAEDDYKKSISEFISKHEEIEDCLFGLMEMTPENKDYQKSAQKNGTLTYIFKINGLTKPLKLNDLTTSSVIRSLNSIRDRVEHIHKGTNIYADFDQNKLTLIFVPNVTIPKSLVRLMPRKA
jgi:hypothetical protein